MKNFNRNSFSQSVSIISTKRKSINNHQGRKQNQQVRKYADGRKKNRRYIKKKKEQLIILFIQNGINVANIENKRINALAKETEAVVTLNANVKEKNFM